MSPNDAAGPREELRERMQCQGITDADVRELKALGDRLKGQLPRMLNTLPARMREHSGIANAFERQLSDGSFERIYSAHWTRVFEGRLDEQYIFDVKEQAIATSRAGVRPRYLLAMFGVLHAELTSLVSLSLRLKGQALANALSLISRLVYLDLNIRMSVYFAEAEKLALDRQRTGLASMRTDFEATLGRSVDSIADVAAEITPEAENLASATVEMRDQTDKVTHSAEAITENVDEIAGAVEELAGSIQVITASVEDDATRINQGVKELDRSNELVTGLSQEAEQINDVVQKIHEIAEQTNLLALNATIEAARAGEAGKGFAVVATEVKNLATQTAKATEDITSQIGSIQASSKNAVELIRGVGTLVGHISESAGEVLSAVREQDQAAKNISSSVRDTIARVSGMMGAIRALQEQAKGNGDAASRMTGQSKVLGDRTRSLSEASHIFLERMAKA